MRDFLIFGGILAGWIVLNAWILPAFGIRTCMSGGCRNDSCSPCGAGSWCNSADDAPTATPQQQPPQQNAAQDTAK